MARYELWYSDPLGNRISYISNVTRFSYVLVSGDVGVLQLATPLRGLEHEAKIPDRRIVLFRQAYDVAQRLEMVSFLESFTYATSLDGLGQFSAGASGPNVLLHRRINAYNSGSASSSYATSTSNAMRQVFRRNLGDNAPAARDISAYVTFADAIGQGATVNKQAAYKNCLALLQSMQAFSKQAGAEIFFGIVPTSETALEFRQFSGQPGADRTSTSGGIPVVFSLLRGNLLNPSLTYDYAAESNYIYAGGKGQQDQRNVQEAENTASTGLSPFARKEKFISALSGVLDNSDDEVLAIANDGLEKYRPRVNLTGTIISTPSSAYGKDWFFGDKVTVDYAGFQFDTVIRAVQVQVDGDGRERIEARVELSNE